MKRSAAIVLGVIGLSTLTAQAQEPEESSRHIELVVQAGLIQPILLRGGNIEIDLIVDRWVIGYSHGFLLELEGNTVIGDARDQGLAYDLPFSTGLSVGRMIFDWLDVRAEFKWHRFKVHYDTSRDINGGGLFSYDTFTLGAGIYAHWRPWRSRNDWSKGLNLSGSLRFWPNVGSTLSRGRRAYDNEYLGQRVTHVASNIGIANTPFLFNISVGYAFELAE